MSYGSSKERSCCSGFLFLLGFLVNSSLKLLNSGAVGMQHSKFRAFGFKKAGGFFGAMLACLGRTEAMTWCTAAFVSEVWPYPEVP